MLSLFIDADEERIGTVQRVSKNPVPIPERMVMLKTGILNPQINSLLSRVRHADTGLVQLFAVSNPPAKGSAPG
jgi:hypothetical protein